MPDKPKKFVTEARRLQAFALYTMAMQHYKKTQEFQSGVCEVLGLEEQDSQVSDAIYGYESSFDDLFKTAGLAVRPKKSRRRT